MPDCEHRWRTKAVEYRALYFANEPNNTYVLTTCAKCGTHRVFSLPGIWALVDLQDDKEVSDD